MLASQSPHRLGRGIRRSFIAAAVLSLAAGAVVFTSPAGADVIGPNRVGAAGLSNSATGTKIAASGHGMLTPRGIVDVASMSSSLANIRSGSHAALLGPTSHVVNASSKVGKSGTTAAVSPLVTIPTVIKANFGGTTNAQSSCGCQPPDTNGAVGPKNIVEAVNLALTVYSRAGVLIKRTSLATFFGTTRSLSDPRVMYDQTWKRWVLTVIPIPGTPTTTPGLLVAASTTANPAGTWFTYSVGFGGSIYPAGTLLDYPMMGMDSDSILISSNNFQLTSSGFSYINSAVFAIAKQRLYTGNGFGFSSFGVGYSAHPAVAAGFPQNQYGRSYIVSANGSGGFSLWYMQNSSRPDSTSVTYQGDSAGALWASPPTAPQPGGFGNLDTLDGRLQAPPVQVGGFVWFAHTRGLGSFPGVQYGAISLADQTAFVADAFVNGSSNDWNPSIGVFDAGSGSVRLFVSWAFNDPANNLPVSLRVSGVGPGEGVPSLVGLGTTVFTGSNGTNSRFGDYSSTTIDPAPASSTCGVGNVALVVNETFAANNDWQTRLARVSVC